jgi:hypothetical protein
MNALLLTALAVTWLSTPLNACLNWREMASYGMVIPTGEVAKLE